MKKKSIFIVIILMIVVCAVSIFGTYFCLNDKNKCTDVKESDKLTNEETTSTKNPNNYKEITSEEFNELTNDELINSFYVTDLDVSLITNYSESGFYEDLKIIFSNGEEYDDSGAVDGLKITSLNDYIILKVIQPAGGLGEFLAFNKSGERLYITEELSNIESYYASSEETSDNFSLSALVVKDEKDGAQGCTVNEEIFDKYCNDGYSRLNLTFELDENLNLKVSSYECSNS